MTPKETSNKNSKTSFNGMNINALKGKDGHHIKLEQIRYVEFAVDELAYTYQFKVWNAPSKPLFILVKKSSDIMKKLKEGDVFNMKYYPSVPSHPLELKTEIEYISNADRGRFEGHHLVGLKVLHKQN